MPDALVRTAREQLYVGLFCTASLPYGRPYSQQASNLSSNGWTRFIAGLYKSEETLRHTAVALSTAILGVQNHDSQLSLKGLQAYNRALREMSKALKQPHRFRGDGLFATSRMMQLYELFFGHVASWRGHIEGNVALILARGPDAFASEGAHQMFADSRILAVMLYFGQRVKSPLSTPEWRTVPWRHREKSVKDVLMDIMDDMPELFEQLDNIQSRKSGTNVDALRERLKVQCRETEVALNAWRRHVGVKLHRFDYTLTRSPIPPPSSDVEFALLHMTSLYWIACLVLYSTMIFVSKGIRPSNGLAKSDSESTSKPLDKHAAGLPPNPDLFAPSMEPRMFASKIARSIHLFFEPSAGFVQSGSALFPLAIALRYFAVVEPSGQRSEEAKMLQRLLRQPFMGTYVGRFLEALERDAQSSKGQDADDKEMESKMWWYEAMQQNLQ
ncbi:hypothetical protein TOPH_07313 [Tolypocladium ophioglossoides CBS 100239]|uniref:Sterol uptake control protein 2 n=1 Tax=Tolypocladium ophioglossoides (strain CBS 100239) TaxID=1163406 RepID=A0A0L0N1Q5_TOLOC|nr:hypothetical protein TOPH_07313 [Tolypocladium ophioglossoides CBS 100239]